MIILYNPDWRDLERPGRYPKGFPYSPLELQYIQGALAVRGRESFLLDLWGRNVRREEAEAKIREAKFIVLTTAPTYVFWRDGIYDLEFPLEQMRYLRRLSPSATIICVGPQATATPDCFAGAPVDYLVRGEPDLTVGELIDRLIRKESVKNMDGISYSDEGRWVHVGPAKAVDDLDLLPDLNYSPLVNGTYGIVAYEAGRGCPFECIFCFRTGFRDKFRKKGIDKIGRELTHLKEVGTKRIFLIDETFGLDPKWTKSFCETIKGLDLRWLCQTRAECLSPMIIGKMAESHCESLHIGLESADPTVLKGMNKSVDPKSLRESISSAVESGMGVFLFCILGAPGETKASIRKTRDYALSLQSPRVEAHAYEIMPFPGTPLWNMGRREGLPLNTWEDVPKFAGIIGNKFRNPQEVIRECARFNRWMEWKSLRAKPNPTFPERLCLFRMYLTARFPCLMGLRGKLGIGKRSKE